MGVDAVLGNGYGIQGKIKLWYLQEMKYQQGFTTEIWYWVSNVFV